MNHRLGHAASIVALVLALAFIPAALAAKGGGGGKPGGGGGTSTLSLKMVTDLNGNGTPNWGDTITFSISTTATTSPYVNLSCYQGGVLVASGDSGFFAGYPWATQNMTLRSTLWSGGAADCTATLYYFGSKGKVTLATLPFHVDP